MNHLPSSIRAAMPKFPVDGTEAEQNAWFEALGPAPGIKHVDDEDDDDDDDAEEDATSIAEFEAGGGVPHEIVAEWLNTWGDADHLPFWDWYAARNG